MQDIWIILVNYRGADDTIECLTSLQAESDAAHVLVIDNASGDRSTERIHAAHPWVELVSLDENTGFTGGNNVGIRMALAANAKYIWLLNNDTTVEPGVIGKLRQAIESDATLGAITPRIDYYDDPNVPWFNGSHLDVSKGLAIHVNDSQVSGAGMIELPWLTGCSMFLRAEAIGQAQGFDDRFFLNWEDVDLSMRLTAIGWKLAILPDCRIHHKVSRSLNKVSALATYYWNRNRLLWLRIHGNQSARRVAIRQGCRMALSGIFRRKALGWSCLIMILRAFRDDLRGKYGCYQ